MNNVQTREVDGVKQQRFLKISTNTGGTIKYWSQWEEVLEKEDVAKDKD